MSDVQPEVTPAPLPAAEHPAEVVAPADTSVSKVLAAIAGMGTTPAKEVKTIGPDFAWTLKNVDPIAALEASLPPPRIPAPEPPSPTVVNLRPGSPAPWEDWRNMLPGTPEFPVWAARDDRHFGEGWCGGGPVLNTLCPSCEYRGQDSTCAGPVQMETVRDVGKYVKCHAYRSLLVQP